MAQFPDSNTISFKAIFEGKTAEQTPLWGSMTLQHMVEHLELVYNRSYTEEPIEIVSPEDRLEKLKYFLMSDKPLVQNFQAPFLPKDPVPYQYESLREAIDALEKSRENFISYFEGKGDAFTVNHILFGALNYNEWVRFHDKHVGHHLAQFALWELGA